MFLIVLLSFCSGSMGKADGAAKMSAKDLYGKFFLIKALLS